MTVEEDPWTYGSTRIVFKTILVIADLFGLTVFCLLLSWIVVYNSGFSWFTSSGTLNFHIFFMSLFLIFLQGNTSLIYRMFPSNPKFFNKLLHAFFHFLICVGMTFALVAIVHYHKLANSPNITTLHSWIGVITISIYYLQFVVGFFMYLYPGGTLDLRVFSIPIHKVIGRSLFISSIIAAATGVLENAIWSVGDAYSSIPLPQNALLLNFAGFFAIIFVIGIIYLLSDHIFRRRQPLFPSMSGSTGQTVFYGSTSSRHLSGGGGVRRDEKVVY